MASKLNIEEVKALTNAIYRRYGLDFTNYEMKSLSRGFARLMSKSKLKNSLELWSKILNDKDFFKDSIDDLMVNLTELFRNPVAWNYLRTDILSQYQNREQLDIWHAGCATGEEVYTTAILLKEMNLLAKSKALASDLSNRALDIALLGKYSSNMMNNYQKSFKSIYPDKDILEYFELIDDHYFIKEEFKKYVEFRNHNLVHDEMDQKFDIIFCRNVMIYFDDVLKAKVLKMFGDSLKPDGLLITGFYDTLPQVVFENFNIYNNSNRIYIKK